MSQTGRVYLVGAGPGDPGLLTLRGLECLQTADVILYDGLVNPLLLRYAAGHVERTARVDGPEGRRLEQPEINARLIALAREGRCVVRLKGGDPFVFGRGAEEAEALADAGIPFEVIPGVTAAIAAAEYAGISLTHREESSAVAFVTGHEDPSKPTRSLEADVLARFPGTLVFYMGLHRLGAIADSLIRAGMPPSTPVAVISRATTPEQRTVSGALDGIATRVEAAGLHAPSVIVIGPGVARRDRLAWFERRPLLGLRIGITRPEEQAGPQIRAALALGAEPVLLPMIHIAPPDDWSVVDAAAARLCDFDWLVFTSSNGVHSFLGRLWETGRDLRSLSGVRVAAIGPSTAAALAEFRLRADVVPEAYRAEQLAEALRPHVAGQRVLWARASRARDVLPEQLRAAGAHVDELVVYRHEDVETLPQTAVAALEGGTLHWIGLSSPAIARQLARLLPPQGRAQLGRTTRLAAISPVTATAARECGLPIACTATTYTWDGLFAAILEIESPGSKTPQSR
jgi:uroporphyrinogen III methyltransferase/synthase